MHLNFCIRKTKLCPHSSCGPGTQARAPRLQSNQAGLFLAEAMTWAGSVPRISLLLLQDHWPELPSILCLSPSLGYVPAKLLV